MSPQNPQPAPDQLEMLSWIASLGAVTAEALACRTDMSVSSARARLVAAKRRKLLTCDRPLLGRPSLFTLTRAGLRASQAHGIPICTVNPSNATHLIVCAGVAAALERCYPDHRLTGERELRRDERRQGRALASAEIYDAERARRKLHRPDLVLWPSTQPAAPPIAVEVELTIKAPRRLVEICRGWARCRTIAATVYLAPPAVERALLRAIAAARATERVHVVPLDSLPGVAPLHLQTTDSPHRISTSAS
jgi:hypothetical protein